MTIVAILLATGAVLAAIAAGFWWLKNQFPAVTRTALQQMEEDFIRRAGGQLDLQREKGLRELESNKQAVEHSVKGLGDQLKRYEELLKQFETDRDKKYGRLEGELARVTKGTESLQMTTANLIAVLGNSRIRGQWGQKMAEDILRLCGLQEGRQYVREKEMIAGRPDYTFLLPEEHTLFMDVKFPLDNYLRFMSSDREDTRQQYREAFIKDVRGHIREMERRDYHGQADKSIDYILIFIPNEQVYCLVNEWIPTLIDECLQKKVILCGPSTLYAMLRIITQAWQNYHYSLAIHDIVKAIGGFMQDYGKFKERFGELEGLIQKLGDKYSDISTKSFRRLDTRIQRIEEYRKGQRIAKNLWSGRQQGGRGMPEPEGSGSEPEDLLLEGITKAGAQDD